MARPAFSYAKKLRPALLAHMAARLDALICRQTKEILADANVTAPVKSISIMIFLSKHGAGSAADIAAVDNQSHQLIKARLKPLEDLGLVKSAADPTDDRKRVLSLTAKGAADARRIEATSRSIADAIERMNEDLGVDLMTAIERAEKSLTRLPLSERI